MCPVTASPELLGHAYTSHCLTRTEGSDLAVCGDFPFCHYSPRRFATFPPVILSPRCSLQRKSELEARSEHKFLITLDATHFLACLHRVPIVRTAVLLLIVFHISGEASEVGYNRLRSCAFRVTAMAFRLSASWLRSVARVPRCAASNIAFVLSLLGHKVSSS